MTISRRRFIAISAAVALSSGSANGAQRPFHRWSGTAMGARASLVVSGMTEAEFNRLVGHVTAEINRLENIFSLYRTESELSRLNAGGMIDNPSGDFLRLLSLADPIHRKSDGVFDPTVQPLWRLHAETGGRPQQGALARARELIGWNNVRFDRDRVAFGKPGMALTLNGIAQGYATDRVAELLRQFGLRNVLVSIGEIAALGERRPGKAWRIGISQTETGDAEETIGLSDLAVATSSPSGLSFGAGDDDGHILSPVDGRPVNHWRRISVIHRSAAMADGLSTAFCAMTERQVFTTLSRFPDTRVIAIDRDGKRVTGQS
ncbi:MAG: FAD:protein FMN transferase [Rhizobiaceae bacterium]